MTASRLGRSDSTLGFLRFNAGRPHDALARDDLHFVSVSSLYLGRA